MLECILTHSCWIMYHIMAKPSLMLDEVCHVVCGYICSKLCVLKSY